MNLNAVDAKEAIEAVFRKDSGRILATLIRVAGGFDRAEEALQEAFAAALVAWSERGLPENPAAWITVAARRKLIDYSRAERTKRDKEDSIRYEMESRALPSPAEPVHMLLNSQSPEYDDRLRLMFTCCHPALNQESQIALTLRTLGGLTTPEIAKAFLTSESTLAQRLVRAKRKIHEARIPYEIPPPHRLAERLAPLRAVLYLIFNEGYAASSGDCLVRRDLCAEAIRLARVLNDLLPDDAENLGLLALMLLHDSRRDARIQNAQLVILEEQDRSLWHREQIAEGIALLESALRRGPTGPYQLQAAIAGVHAEAITAAETDWRQIAALYATLYRLNPSPVVALNQAVSIAMSEGFAAGLSRLDELEASSELDGYYLLHAARADFLRRLGRTEEARVAYERALTLTVNPVEREFLKKRLAGLRLILG